MTASGLASQLAELTGAEQDRAGRVTVEADLTLPGHPEVFALGDMVRVRGRDGSAITLPGVAPVAMQQGRYAAKAVRARLQGRTAPPFRYRDKGNLATIGRAAAVADIKGVKLSGFLAWMTWLVVHLFYLVGFQNRLLVLIRWSISFATRGRGARLITDPADAEAPGRPAAQPDTVSPSGIGTGMRHEYFTARTHGHVRDRPSTSTCKTAPHSPSLKPTVARASTSPPVGQPTRSPSSDRCPGSAQRPMRSR